MKGIMIQGTASDVGKSILTAALCRLFINEGYHVAPFKSQNMTSELFITQDGLKISKIQAVQSEAAKTEPTIWMNPIVLNPKTDTDSEIIMLGKSVEISSGKNYRDNFYEQGLNVIKQSLAKLKAQYEIIIMEGAGSPVEINLKNKELVNMKVAEIADVPVILVADIERGGVFASIFGTIALLSEGEKKRVKGIIINKFRGDRLLFADGIEWIEKNIGIPVLGVIPFVEHHIGKQEVLLNSNTSNCINDEYDAFLNQIKDHLDYKKIKEIVNNTSI